MNLLITAVFVIIYYIFAIFLVRGVRFNTKNLCISGIVIAMTMVLESIVIPLPTGATVSLCSPVPLLLLAILVDYKLAIVSGWVCGILAMFFIPGWQIVHWGQFFVEHLICFSCLGFAGIFGSTKRWKILCGIAIASAIKIAAHLFSGVLFFSQNAWDGWGAWGYSWAYNLSQSIPLCLLSAVVICALPLKNLSKAIGRS